MLVIFSEVLYYIEKKESDKMIDLDENKKTLHTCEEKIKELGESL